MNELKIENIEITNNCFKYISKILNEEIGLGYINNFQNIDFDTIKLKVHRKQTKEIIINTKLMYLPTYKIPVNKESLEFIKYLKRKLNNQRIKEIKQHSNNKVIYFKLDNFYLIFEFFSNSNIILTDLDFIVISARRYEKWKDRKIIRKEKYDFPKCEYLLDHSNKEILNEIKELDSKSEIIKFFVRKYKIAPYYINNIFKNVKNIKDEKELLKTINKIKEIFNLDMFSFKFISKNNKELLVVNKSDNKKDNKKQFLEVESKFFKKEENIDKQEQNKKENKITNILNIQEKTLRKFNKLKEEYKQKAEQIYVNFTTIDQINKQIKIAVDKKIPSNKIKDKINTYFINKNINLRIKEIDLKNRNYTLEIK
jgi:predicted ribosome quality control (RQC) complex YloA/Tae2 family protein